MIAGLLGALLALVGGYMTIRVAAAGEAALAAIWCCFTAVCAVLATLAVMLKMLARVKRDARLLSWALHARDVIGENFVETTQVSEAREKYF